MNLTATAAAVSAALAGVAGYALAWNIQAKILVDTKLEHANERIEQQRGARAAIERATSQVITAQNAAAARNDANRIAAGGAAAAGNGLRIASTTAVRTSTADSNACSALVGAYGVILDEGSRLLGEVAAIADQCISDNKALTDSWPN